MRYMIGFTDPDEFVLGNDGFRFQKKDGDIRVTKFDRTHTHLDDVESLVIRVDFPFLLTTVDVVVEVFLDEALLQGCQCIAGHLHITEDDCTTLPSDGVDSQFF